jgi:hypothetical protein
MTISSNCEYPVKNNRKVERELEKQTQYGRYWETDESIIDKFGHRDTEKVQEKYWRCAFGENREN